MLVLAASSGAMKIVAQQDQPFDVSGDGTDLRVVSRITAGGLSESGVLVFRLDFTNSTSGIFTASAAQAPGSSGGLQVDKSAGRSGQPGTRTAAAERTTACTAAVSPRASPPCHRPRACAP